MKTPPRILVVDDNPMNLDILRTRLAAHGYDVCTAIDGEQALAAVHDREPDLTLLDVMMPKIDGIEVCRRLKADKALPFMPIIMVTAKSDTRDIVTGLEAGADEYLTKPVDQGALVARVKSMLRIKELHDTAQGLTHELAELNRTLEQKVRDQLDELERVGRLKRFFSPHLADLIVARGGSELLKSHRREISVVFSDLRGFTAFSETAEPEQVMGVLQDYYDNMGNLIFRYEGTVERFAGDGIMVLFNDPLPCPEHELRAVRMAVEMRERARQLVEAWSKREYHLGLGIGIAQGYATLGEIGFEGRFEYSAIGSVSNLASRLCDAAEDGQILVSQRICTAVEERAETELIGELEFKGFHRPVRVYNVVKMDEQCAT